MTVILMTTLFYKALLLPGEIWCWSLLGLKGLTSLIVSILTGSIQMRVVKQTSDAEITALVVKMKKFI